MIYRIYHICRSPLFQGFCRYSTVEFHFGKSVHNKYEGNLDWVFLEVKFMCRIYILTFKRIWKKHLEVTCLCILESNVYLINELGSSNIGRYLYLLTMICILICHNLPLLEANYGNNIGVTVCLNWYWGQIVIIIIS